MCRSELVCYACYLLNWTDSFCVWFALSFSRLLSIYSGCIVAKFHFAHFSNAESHRICMLLVAFDFVVSIPNKHTIYKHSMRENNNNKKQQTHAHIHGLQTVCWFGSWYVQNTALTSFSTPNAVVKLSIFYVCLSFIRLFVHCMHFWCKVHFSYIFRTIEMTNCVLFPSWISTTRFTCTCMYVCAATFVVEMDFGVVDNLNFSNLKFVSAHSIVTIPFPFDHAQTFPSHTIIFFFHFGAIAVFEFSKLKFNSLQHCNQCNELFPVILEKRVFFSLLYSIACAWEIVQLSLLWS